MECVGLITCHTAIFGICLDVVWVGAFSIQLLWKLIMKQESPPAWTQEAYRPPCSEYSFCPGRGGTWPGTPPRGSGYPPGGLGTPLGVRVPPRGVWVPSQGGPGTPPGGVPDRVPPTASWHSGKCCKALWDMGTPPPPCGQTDGWMEGQTLVKTLPSLVLRTRAVNMAHCAK